MSYSQYNEEVYILNALACCETAGVFLDIGAYDGVTFSNTRALAEMGWGGVLIEPSPWLFSALLGAYEDNPKVELVNALVGTTDRFGLRKFWPSADAVSTTEEDIYEKWKPLVKYSRPVWAPQVTLNDLLLQFPQLHAVQMVSIDTEGTSVDIFKEWPIERIRPKVFCIEYDDKLADVANIAKAANYDIVHTNGTNVVLVR